jgi:4-amino-4-deoxy-L-arabinose transferase-like glycosyltransferase
MPGLSKLAQSAQEWFLGRKDYMAALSITALALIVSYRMGFPRIAWSDEVLYAVVARNLVEHGSLQTTLYYPEAIVRGGYPLRDVHMPGYMLLLALPVALFGPTDAALMLPSRVAFLLSGLLIYWLGKQLFSPAVGYASVVAFCAYPVFFNYANTAMVELALVLIALLYFGVWVAALDGPRLYQGVVLAVLLAMGILVRETFFVFLPAALYAVWRWPGETRRRASLLFAASFLVLLAGVVYPLSQGRSYYPNSFSNVLDMGDLRLIANGFLDNFSLQASRYIREFDNFPEDHVRTIQAIIVLLGLVALLRFQKKGREAAGYFLLASLVAWLFLSIFFTSNGWRGLRQLMMTLPPGLILLNGLVFSLRPTWVRLGLFGTQLALFCVFTWFTAQALTADRADHYKEDYAEARILAENIGAYHPHMVLAYRPWLYALQFFPVNVIYRWPDSLGTWQGIQQHVVIDAIVVDNPAQRDQILQASQVGLIAGKFRPVNREAVEGYYFLVRGDLFKDVIDTALGSDLTLLGVDTLTAARAGDPLPLTLVWKARTDISADYALAVRLVDAQGQEAQYWLGRPVLSSYPTTEWQRGEVVPDTWDIALDPSLSPGEYELEVEAFRTSDGQSVGKTSIGDILVEPVRQ